MSFSFYIKHFPAQYIVFYKPDKLPVNFLCGIKSSFGSGNTGIWQLRLWRLHFLPTVGYELTSQSQDKARNGWSVSSCSLHLQMSRREWYASLLEAHCCASSVKAKEHYMTSAFNCLVTLTLLRHRWVMEFNNLWVCAQVWLGRLGNDWQVTFVNNSYAKLR